MIGNLEIEVAGKREQLSVCQSVCRVGSAAYMEVKLPGLAAHALSLRRQGDKTLIYNRCPDPISVAGKRLPPGATAEWMTGAEIRLAPGIALRRGQRSGAAPVARRSESPDSTASPGEDTESAGPPQRLALSSPLVLVAILGLIAVAFIVPGPGSPAANESAASVIGELLALEHQPEGHYFAEIRFLLQNVVIDFKRSDVPAARDKLRRAKEAAQMHVHDPALRARVMNVIDDWAARP